MRMVLAGLSLAVAGFAFAQDTPQPAPTVPVEAGVEQLATVTVSGAQPGPPLWLVRKGSHELWILGVVSPLPRDMTWQSREVAEVVARSQELIESPSINVGIDAGFFGKLALIPSALKARNNPDGRTLAEVLPAATYARWQQLKARHIGRDGGIEKRRPVAAASELYAEALDDVKLGGKPVVSPVLDPLVKQAGLKRTVVQVKHTIAKPRQMLKEAATMSFEDAPCFEAMLDTVENDLPLMRTRANAWAMGDIDTLRATPARDTMTPCWNAYATTAIGAKAGVSDLPRRMREAWLVAAEAALARNASTLAILPMSGLLRREDYLARLEAKGYEVIEP